MIYGQNPLRESRPIQTDVDGKLLTSAADGADATLGAKSDAAASDATSSWSVTALLKGILAMFRNPAIVTSTTITAAQAAPTLVSQMTAANSISIAGGTVDAVTARITNLGGGAPTIGFYGTDDGVNLYALSGLPISGTIGAGVLAQTGAALGAWSLKGSGVRTVYMVCTALGGGTNIGLTLSATPNMNRVTALLRGSAGGSVSASPGTAPSEAVAVQGIGYRSAPTVTRPGNVTPYTAGDVIGGVIEFQNIGPAGGHIFVTGGDLMIFVAALPTGMAGMRLQVYDATPPSALADNAAWDLGAGDRANYLGYVDLGTPVDVGSTLQVQADQINKQFKLAAGQTSLWCYLMTVGGFTPAGNSEVYMPRLRALGV